MATPILEEKGIELHTFFNVETIDASRRVIGSLEGEELAYDLLILVPPHRGAQLVIDSGIAPGAGWLPTDPQTLAVKGRDDIWALGDATDLPLSKAGSTAHFEAPVVAERVSQAIGHHGPIVGRFALKLSLAISQGIAAVVWTTAGAIASAVISDPCLVIVTEDGYWVEIDRWFS